MRHIALIGCSARKGLAPQPAISLYRGQLFRLAVAWAERHGCEIWILSAKHGLVAPDTVLEPYDHRLHEKELGAWSRRVDGAFRARELYRAERITVLASELYSRWLACRNPHRARPWPCEYPLARLGIGQQKAWLRQASAAAAPEQLALL